MSQTIMQSILWIVSLGILVMYVQRRRKRKADF
jgi:hypothetical protein